MAKRIVLLAALLAAGACKTSAPEAEAVAKVNGESLEKKDFDEQVERNLVRYRGQAQQLPPGIEARIQESVLRRMIDDAIIGQKAKELQIVVSDADIAAKFKEHKERFRSEEAFQEYLKRSNNNEAALKDDLKRSMLREAVIDKLAGDVQVSDADVQKYYSDNAAKFDEPEQIKTRRIIVRLPDHPSAADRKAKLKVAQKLRTLALKPNKPGEDNFAKVAREKSEGPEVRRDGDMGNFFARGHMPQDFDKIAFPLKVGQTSEPSETSNGFEIVQVLDRKVARIKPLAEAQDNIRKALLARSRNERRRDVLRDLKNNAKVETLIHFEGPPPAAAGEGAPPPPGAPGAPPPPGAPGAPPPPGAPGAPPPPGAAGGPPPPGAAGAPPAAGAAGTVPPPAMGTALPPGAPPPAGTPPVGAAGAPGAVPPPAPAPPPPPPH